MSVINQMLQDLESRRGELETEAAAPTHVRPAGVVYERRSSKLALIIGVALVVAAALAWLVLKPEPARPKSESVKIATPARIAPEATVVAPAAKPAAPIAVAPAPTTAPAVPRAPTLPAQSGEENKPPSTAAVAPAPASAFPEVAATATNTAPKVAASEPAGNAVPTVTEPALSSKGARRARDKSALASLDAEPQNFKNRTPQQRIDERYRDALRKLNEGQTNQARTDLIEVLHAQPKHSGARLALVGLELDDKHAPQAERLLREGIQLQPQESTFSMVLARLEVERGDITTALTTLNRGLAHADDDPEYHAFMAALLQRANRHAESIEHYQIALRQREAASWLVGLAISLEGANRAREAEQIYRRAQQSNALPADLQDFVAQRLQQLKS